HAVEGSALVADPLSAEAVNVREFRRLYHRATRLPRSLVEETARVTSYAQQEWVTAYQNADFAQFRPWLEKVVRLKRTEAGGLGYAETAYDALLEEYEPGARTAAIAKLFEGLQLSLVPLVAAIQHARRRSHSAILRREYPIDRQRIFCETVAAAVGFDFT